MVPPFSPGETAECDSDFLSNANVGGLAKQTDATHATVTINQINFTPQLNVVIWLPNKVTQHVIDHEGRGTTRFRRLSTRQPIRWRSEFAQPYMGKAGGDYRNGFAR